MKIFPVEPEEIKIIKAKLTFTFYVDKKISALSVIPEFIRQELSNPDNIDDLVEQIEYDEQEAILHRQGTPKELGIQDPNEPEAIPDNYQPGDL
jgi:hypothetical protein